MGDVVMVATMVAFVVLCVGYVGWCDRILTREDADQGAEGSIAGTSDPAQLEAVS